MIIVINTIIYCQWGTKPLSKNIIVLLKILLLMSVLLNKIIVIQAILKIFLLVVKQIITIKFVKMKMVILTKEEMLFKLLWSLYRNINLKFYVITSQLLIKDQGKLLSQERNKQILGRPTLSKRILIVWRWVKNKNMKLIINKY